MQCDNAVANINNIGPESITLAEFNLNLDMTHASVDDGAYEIMLIDCKGMTYSTALDIAKKLPNAQHPNEKWNSQEITMREYGEPKHRNINGREAFMLRSNSNNQSAKPIHEITYCVNTGERSLGVISFTFNSESEVFIDEQNEICEKVLDTFAINQGS